jgi:NADPH:quinone reductase-like Zn-dependent oxidoreductase
MRFFIGNFNKTDLVLLMEFLEAGKIVPVIDRRYQLTDAAETIRYPDARYASGKVVITLG